MLGAAEQLEFIATASNAELEPLGGRGAVEGFLLKMAKATAISISHRKKGFSVEVKNPFSNSFFP
jgi:hypothetical protein